MRSTIYHLLNDTRDREHIGARMVGGFLAMLIVVNVVAMILETVPALKRQYEPAFTVFELFSISVFLIEYALRVWSSVEDPQYKGFKGRIRFMLTPMALIDLLAILPSLIFTPKQADLRFLRLLRLFRLFRVFKLARYSGALRTMSVVLKTKAPEIMVAGLVGVVLLVFASSVMYVVENQAQPDKFSSIPATMWWAVATLTTVGYGDVYPITPLGKFLGSLIAIMGVGVVALPAGIIASGFGEALKNGGHHNTCPHCGREL